MRARQIAGAPIRGAKRLGQMLFARQGGLIWRFLPRTRFDYKREVGDGLGSSLIMAPILWMARTFPEAPVRVLDTDEAPVDMHEMTTLLRRPNPFYSGIVMWMATILSWVVNGNAYWIKIRNQIGGPVQLWYVPHWMIEPESNDPTQLIEHYVYSPEGRRILLDSDDVVHFRYGLDPDNPALGLSPLASVLREVFTDDEAANFSASLLHNLGIPGLVVSPKDSKAPPSPDDVKATKEYIDEETGGDNRGRPLVMSGPTDVQQFGFSPEQLTLRMLRRIPEERVTAVLGLPAIVAGFGAGLERSTFANYAEARVAAYESNIIPSQRMFAEDLRHQLLPDFEDNPDTFEVAFDLSNVRVLQEDRKQEAERLGQLYKDGVMVRAEARERLHLETTDADQVYAVPVNVVLTAAGRPPELPADPSSTAGAGVDGLKGHTRAQRGFMDAMDREARVLEAVFAEGLVSEFVSLGQLAGDEYSAVVNLEGPALSYAVNGHTKAEIEDGDRRLADRIVAALGISDWIERHLAGRFRAHYGRTLERTVATLNSVLELGVSIPDPVMRQVIADGGTRAGLVDVTTATRDAIIEAIVEARTEGLGPPAVARRIRELVPAGRFTNAGPAYRAQLIARTETKYAQNVSSIVAGRAADTVTGMVAFDARLGGETDAECESRDGQEYSFDEAEAETANEHPNGSLSFAPIVGSASEILEGAPA